MGIMASGWVSQINLPVKTACLVVGPPEKYEFVNWDDEKPNINGNMPKMATKPPTSCRLVLFPKFEI